MSNARNMLQNNQALESQLSLYSETCQNIRIIELTQRVLNLEIALGKLCSQNSSIYCNDSSVATSIQGLLNIGMPISEELIGQYNLSIKK